MTRTPAAKSKVLEENPDTKEKTFSLSKSESTTMLFYFVVVKETYFYTILITLRRGNF